MKILFVWPSPDFSFPMSLTTLSSFMKQFGHETKMISVVSTSNQLTSKHFSNIKETLDEFQPDICAATVFEPMWGATLEAFSFIRKHSSAKLIVGGYFPQLKPDICIQPECIDALCIGEGENGLTEYCEYLKGQVQANQVPNFWIKDEAGATTDTLNIVETGGTTITTTEGTDTLTIDTPTSVDSISGASPKIVKNERVELVTDLDAMPFPDRDCVDFQWYLDLGKPDRSCKILASRGCPLACTYCSVEKFRSMYPNKPSEYMRFRSPDNVIEEIQYLASSFQFESLGFHDDNMMSNKEWVHEFCDKYIAIGKPFPWYCAGRPETADPELARHMKEAGCYLILMGVENGDDHIRRKVMARPMTNQRIIDSFRVIQEAGIGTWSFNMVGAPYETVRTMWQTVKLNWKIKPDFAMCSIFYPLQGTTLGDLCFTEDWVDMEKYRKVNSYATSSVLRLPTMPMWVVPLLKWVVVFTACRKQFFWQAVFQRILGRWKVITREASQYIPKRHRQSP